MTAETQTFIGVDPGPTPGFARLRYRGTVLVRVDVLQCSPELAGDVLTSLLDDVPSDSAWVQVERFVDSARTGRSRNRDDHDTTREVVTAVLRAAQVDGTAAFQRRAVDVKPWATDERLAAAGLLAPTKGMRHARDAVRHALFLACTQGMPDPLSNKTTN